ARSPLSLKYSIPPNVVSIEQLWLFDQSQAEIQRHSDLNRREVDALKQFIELFSDSSGIGMNVSADKLQYCFDILFNEDCRQNKRVLKASGSTLFWDLALDVYNRTASDLPFIQFFYQWRSRIIPLIRIFSYEMPRAGMFYSITAGHAGVAGVVAKLQRRRPLMLTEHGLYPRERRHDMWELSWMRMVGKDEYEKYVLFNTREHWLRYFDRLSFIAYFYSDVITTLFSKYLEIQVQLGADRSRCHTIANGMGLKLLGLRSNSAPWQGFESGKIFRVASIGRVTPIKDIKCLINAITIARRKQPNIRCDIYGPLDQEQAYVESCLLLIKNAGQEKYIKLVGKMPITDILPCTDLLCLTSLSEGQPMVILEAALAGIPVVTSDVGGCRDLVEGDSSEDRDLGPNGLLTPMVDPEQTAEAILKIAENPKLWSEFSNIGMQRATLYYDERRTVNEYFDLFKICLDM
ncbi:MAG: GT4 family glycosyltransferase PelF, partial [Proteobacteria bacterium]|nr:GT4 family glycosyltransferase PelF [Pseudomonadota bacterium]